jgi:hypothetical protein
MRWRNTFLGLVAVQVLHSLEEYRGRLYDVFPPARLVSGLIIFNVALVVFGVWCFLWPIRRCWPSATGLAWIWVGIELINGIGHPLWSLAVAGYTPGIATAPFLLVLALYLARQLTRSRMDCS